jgi:hypothetical protein
MTEHVRADAFWGPWLTVALGLVILVAFLSAQTVITVAYLVFKAISDPEMGLRSLAENAMGDGMLLSLALIGSSVVGCGFVLLFAWLKARAAAMSYLAVVGVPGRALAVCIGATVLFVVAADSLTYLLGRSIVPDYMASAYESVSFKPLLWIAVCVGAPFC